MSTWSELKNTPRLKQIYEERIQIIRLIREFFWSENFVETDTPIAVKYPGQEPYLFPVPVTLHDPAGVEFGFHLQTSPEFAMKKLLASGWSKIFQICKCFRDYESFGGQHNTEFTMIEWYRAPGTLENIMDDTERLFKYIATHLRPDLVGTTARQGKLEIRNLKFKNKEINIMDAWDRMSMKEVWQKYVGVNLDEYLELEPMRKLVSDLNIPVSIDDAYEDLFFKIFLNKIESNLGNERPVFVYDYPASMSSLSRRCAHDPRYAERFELYIGGLELANAFGELTDAKEQKKRLEEDKAKRIELKKETWPVDPDFISALESGIPASIEGMKAALSVSNEEALPRHSVEDATAGIALGIDRMVLLFTEAQDINEVMFQSVKDQVVEAISRVSTKQIKP